MKLLTQEQHEYLVSIVKGRTSNECTEMLNQKFNLSLKISQIRAYKKNHNLTGDIDTRFKKGSVPLNKGCKVTSLEILERIRHTWFKKGQKARNHKPVGSERITVDGYVEVKVAEPNIWKLKHRLIWEEYHGELSKDMMISFINGDSTDCRIENLVVLNKQVNALFNTKFKTRQRTPELVAVANDIVQIKNRLKELRNE